MDAKAGFISNTSKYKGLHGFVSRKSKLFATDSKEQSQESRPGTFGRSEETTSFPGLVQSQMDTGNSTRMSTNDCTQRQVGAQDEQSQLISQEELDQDMDILELRSDRSQLVGQVQIQQHAQSQPLP